MMPFMAFPMGRLRSFWAVRPSNVYHQGLAASKAPVTVEALIQPFIQVDLLVPPGMKFQTKCLLAHMAHVWLLHCVYPLVPGKVAGQHAGLLASVKLVQTCVCAGGCSGGLGV